MCRKSTLTRKKKAILDRIVHLEDAIAKGRGYLENGEHAHWHGFRPLFDVKVRDGRTGSDLESFRCGSVQAFGCETHRRRQWHPA
jgi:hypothetical protein